MAGDHHRRGENGEEEPAHHRVPEQPVRQRELERRLGLPLVGAAIDAPVIAPGIPPDLSVGEGTLHGERIPAPADQPGARYLVEFQRSNWITSALLVCDDAHRPVRIEFGSEMAYWHSYTEESEVDEEDIVRCRGCRSQSRAASRRGPATSSGLPRH